MLVFRCECEQVLGVDDDSNKGGMGECPTCGRIIRVPASLVNGAGKLRLAGSPARAMSASGAFRQIKETPKNGTAIPNTAGRSNGVSSSSARSAPVFAAAVAEAAAISTAKATPIAPAIVPPTAVPLPSKAATPEMGVKVPATDSPPDAPTEIGMQLLGLDAAAETVTAKSVVPAQSKPNVISARKDKVGSARKLPAKNQKFATAKSESNDPSAAIETKNDRNIAAVANAAASSKRSKVEAPAPAKKNWMLIYMIALVAALVIAGICYAMGVFSKEEPKTPAVNSGAGAQTTKVTTPSTTPETKAAVSTDAKVEPVKPPEPTDAKPPADPEKKDDKKDSAETKTDDTKKEEKKDPAADVKVDEKKTN